MKNIVCVLLVCFNLFVFANPIDTNMAKKAALLFLQSQPSINNQKSIQCLSLVYQAESHQKSNENPVYFYIYNSDNNAFVIVSGTDQTLPILGYSLQSTFDPNTIPVNMLSFLSEYQREMDYIHANNMVASSETFQAWEQLLKGKMPLEKALKTSVSPLIKTRWSQSPYYNRLCPYDSQSHSRAVTGCVATAMAQVINYWAFPSVGYSDHSYVHDYFGYLEADFKNTTYQYNLMPITLTNTTTSDSMDAVATLIYHCGVAVEMDYGVYESGAYIDEYTVGKQSAEYAMRIYFGYSDVKCESRYALGDLGWINLLKTEISAGRPVLYRGQGDQGGHAFVCDGYDANNYFHFNWGWNGSEDGYFLITSLNPGSYYDFTSYQGALYNIVSPNKMGTFHLVLFNDLQLSSSKLSCEEPFTLTTKVLNNGQNVFQGDFKAVILNGAGSEVSVIEIKSEQTVLTNHDTLLLFSSEGVSGIAAGAYKVKLFYRKTNDSVWVPVVNVGSYVNETVIQFEGDITVSTDSISDVKAQSAKLYGSLSEGCANVIDMGFKWKKESVSQYNTVTADSTFEYLLTNLEPNTAYRIKSYLTTYSGSTYGNVFGNELTFTTALAGIKELDNSTVHIYPNPANDFIHIAFQNNTEVEKIEIINTLGVIIKREISPKSEINISIENFTSGVYYVNIFTKLGVIRKKIAVE